MDLDVDGGARESHQGLLADYRGWPPVLDVNRVTATNICGRV